MEALSVGHNMEDFGSKRNKKIWKLVRKEGSPALLCMSVLFIFQPSNFRLPFHIPYHRFLCLFSNLKYFFNLRGCYVASYDKHFT